MSKNSSLIDTSPGGEQTQYEGEHTDMDPPSKLPGQFGEAAKGTTSSTQINSASNEPNTQGITPAEKIRFGQAISEEGVGGKTTGLGEATTEGGFGGTKALNEDADSFSKERREQGYGGSGEQNRHIGG